MSVSEPSGINQPFAIQGDSESPELGFTFAFREDQLDRIMIVPDSESGDYDSEEVESKSA